jgi:hypothetical protein
MKVGLAILLSCLGCGSKSETKPAEPPPEKKPEPAKPEPAKPEPERFKMSKEPTDGCDGLEMFKLDTMNVPIEMMIPMGKKFRDLEPGVQLGDRDPSEKSIWALRIYPARVGKDDDFTKEKARIEADEKKHNFKLTWIKSEKTDDGFRMAYSQKNADGSVEYEVLQVRTIAGKKWVCWNDSHVEASIGCAQRACESMKAI